MTKKEITFYKQMRNVPADKALAAAKKAMSAAAEKRFKAENEARRANIARMAPAHDAMRSAMEKNPDFAKVQKALAGVRKQFPRPKLPPLRVPPSPKAYRLRLGSIHLVDVPPFQALTWSGVSVNGEVGDTNDDVQELSADGTTGNMSFNIVGGGLNTPNNSSVSCWAAIGQTYVMPEGAESPETGGASLRFSANPSFNWSAIWGSDWYRLASGTIWIGQVINRFDSSWTLIDTPVSYQTTLESWNDYNFGDAPSQSGSNTSFGLSTGLFVQPGFFYNGWVWIGASAYGDQVDSGWSLSNAIMEANVSSLIFDTF